MRILLALRSISHFRHFSEVVQHLSDDGHCVRIVFDKESKEHSTDRANDCFWRRMWKSNTAKIVSRLAPNAMRASAISSVMRGIFAAIIRHPIFPSVGKCACPHSRAHCFAFHSAAVSSLARQ
jgi:hypothetical protein